MITKISDTWCHTKMYENNTHTCNLMEILTGPNCDYRRKHSNQDTWQLSSWFLIYHDTSEPGIKKCERKYLMETNYQTWLKVKRQWRTLRQHLMLIRRQISINGQYGPNWQSIGLVAEISRVRGSSLAKNPLWMLMTSGSCKSRHGCKVLQIPYVRFLTYPNYTSGGA